MLTNYIYPISERIIPQECINVNLVKQSEIVVDKRIPQEITLMIKPKTLS